MSMASSTVLIMCLSKGCLKLT